jgi:hypothetical protein
VPDARVEPVEIDVWGARAFMERSRELLADGARSENTPASRMILLHSAAMAACDAILSINGKRIVGSDGSHRLRLKQAETLLRGDNRRLFATLEDSRASRNLASYAAGSFLPTTSKLHAHRSMSSSQSRPSTSTHSRPAGPWTTERSI